ncbi:MAG: TonB-dependent siderophore receptor [Proteobacteria bacterium]|nr:TonB-dependent siderophore receptor [Pseudomonadota bacterium]
MMTLISSAHASDTQRTPETFAVSIDRQPLDGALQELAHQCDIQVVFFSRVTEGLSAPAIHGNYTLAAAMDQLLAGSGLTSRVLNSQMVEVRPPQARDTDRIRTNEIQASQDSKPTDPTSTPLQEVVVVGLAEQLVATRIATPIRDIPQTISIVTGEEMRQRNDATLQEVLEHAPGITTDRQSSVDQAFYSRGYRITSFHIDGGAAVDPQFEPNELSNTLFLGTPDMLEFDHVEILRGVDGLFSGDGNPGGTISLVRKRPQRNFALTFSASAGSWGNRRDEIDITGPMALGGDLRGRLAAVSDREGYFYNIDPHDKKKVFGSLGYDLTPFATLTAGASYQWDRAAVIQNGLPFYSDGSDPRFPRDTALRFDWTQYRSSLFGAYLQYRHELSPRWTLKLNASHWRTMAQFGLPFVSGEIDPVTNKLNELPQAEFSVTPNTNTQDTTDVTLSGALDWLGWREELALGADFTRLKVAADAEDYYQKPLTDFRAFNPRDYPDPRALGPPAYEIVTNAASDRYGMYVSSRIYFGHAWSISGGARLSRDHTDVLFTFPGLPQSLATRLHTDSVVTPYAGLMYSFRGHYSLYASYADIYLAQGSALEQSPGQFLGPIRGTNVEAGVKGEWRDGALNASLAAYRIEQSNLPIATTPPTNQITGAPKCCFDGESNHSRGIDADISGQVLPGWHLGVGYSYNINESPTTHPLSTVTPRHLLKVWTNWRLPGDLRPWEIGGGLHAQSRTTTRYTAICIDAPNFLCPPAVAVAQSYAVFDLRAAFNVDPHWRVALSVNNVLDKRYYESIDSFQGWYGRPRNWLLRIDARY